MSSLPLASGNSLAMQPSLHHQDKLGEALKASKTTTDISQILASSARNQ